MSTQYKHESDVPVTTIIERLLGLSDAVTQGREAVAEEFTMRIPAELDRDADLVLSSAALRLGQLTIKVKQMEDMQDVMESAELNALRCRVAEFTHVLEKCRFALEPYNDIKPRDWSTDRTNLISAHEAVIKVLTHTRESL